MSVTHQDPLSNGYPMGGTVFCFLKFCICVRAGVSISRAGRGGGGGLRMGMALGPPMALRTRISLLCTMLPH